VADTVSVANKEARVRQDPSLETPRTELIYTGRSVTAHVAMARHGESVMRGCVRTSYDVHAAVPGQSAYLQYRLCMRCTPRVELCEVSDPLKSVSGHEDSEPSERTLRGESTSLA